MQYVFDNCRAVGIYEIKEHFLNPYSNSREYICNFHIHIKNAFIFFRNLILTFLCIMKKRSRF